MRSFATLLALIPLVAADRVYNLYNDCPKPIDIYVNGVVQGTVPVNGSITRQLNQNFTGTIYTDANGGSKDGLQSVRAGFNGTDGYYYLVQKAKSFNTGVSISVIDQEITHGQCGKVSCEQGKCSDQDAFTVQPTTFPAPKSRSAPAKPYYRCKWRNAGYSVTFCPNRRFPTRTPIIVGAKAIQPIRNASKCLDVRGAIFANGTPVQIYDCNGTNAQKWVINRGTGQLRVSGTNFCLDAGSAPKSGVGLKIWTCYDDLAAQRWSYTAENYIKLESKNQCVDLTEGSVKNSQQTQIWTCGTNVQNQSWNAKL